MARTLTHQWRNEWRWLNASLGVLRACAADICWQCVGYEAAKIKAEKTAHKLLIDLDTAPLAEAEKRGLWAEVEVLGRVVAGLRLAESTACLKTAEVCTIGSECFASKAMAFVELLPREEPAPTEAGC
jgi:hypothetical protein